MVSVVTVILTLFQSNPISECSDNPLRLVHKVVLVLIVSRSSGKLYCVFYIFLFNRVITLLIVVTPDMSTSAEKNKTLRTYGASRTWRE